MNTRHFLRKVEKDSEEIYQIFGSSFGSKNNRRTSLSTSSTSQSSQELTSSVYQKPEDPTFSSVENVSNDLINDENDYKENGEDYDEDRFCYFMFKKNGKDNKDHFKDQVYAEIKVDFFQLARLSRKFQKMKKFYNFPFIKRFKLDIKDINEDTFLEFIKSTQGEEFSIKETNFNDFYCLSKEWETRELTIILDDYEDRHKSDMTLFILQYIKFTKEYDRQKERKIEQQAFKAKQKDKILNGYNSRNNQEIGEHKVFSKNKTATKAGQIEKIEEKMKNRIEECFKTKVFWEIRIETIHRIIKEISKPFYSHDLLLECILESIEERKNLIDLINPCLITEVNHRKLVDLQFKLVDKNNNNGQHTYNYINKDLFSEMLQSYQKSNSSENIYLTDQSKSEEIIKLQKELEQKENEIEQKGKELSELRERDIILCNEIYQMKENIKNERKDVRRSKIDVKMREKEVKKSLEEAKKREFENCKREKENSLREEENEKKEKENNQREKMIERKRKEVEIREEDVEKMKSYNEYHEKEIIDILNEIENKQEETKKQEEKNIETEKRIEENKNCIEKEIIRFTEIMEEKEKVEQQQKLIDEFRNILIPEEATTTEMERFLKENELLSIDDRNANGWEAIHIACINGEKKIISYILSKYPRKLNVRSVFIIIIF